MTACVDDEMFDWQHRVARGYLWRRRLPLAGLDDPPFADQLTPWEAVSELADTSLVWAWAQEQDAGARLAFTEPLAERGERNTDGTGTRTRTIYRMPPRSPDDAWADITSYLGTPPVPCCPVPGCTNSLEWWEAGYVPGYRVCMVVGADGSRDTSSIRHRFVLDDPRCWPEMSLVLVSSD